MLVLGSKYPGTFSDLSETPFLGFLLDLFFDPEGDGSMFLQNIREYKPNYSALDFQKETLFKTVVTRM
jgi:hypothetical protein